MNENQLLGYDLCQNLGHEFHLFGKLKVVQTFNDIGHYTILSANICLLHNRRKNVHAPFLVRVTNY